MFSYCISYLAILQAVAERCCLPYVSVIWQIVEDGTEIYGIELELPRENNLRDSAATFFFWAPPGLHHQLAYESASFQALIMLQTIFGFVVVDYSIHVYGRFGTKLQQKT